MFVRRMFAALICLSLAACTPAPSETEESNPSDDSLPAPGEDSGEPASPGSGEQPPAAEPAPSDPVEEPTRVVLLIPGTMIEGSYFDTMAERLIGDGYEPWVFEPPDLFTESLAVGAERIAVAVDEVLEATGEDRINIVAQCDGGVATRYFLQLLAGHQKVDQVITFVSAHHGTWLSPVGDWVTGFDALEDIIPGSAFLDELNGAPFPTGLKLTSIYSCNDELMLPYDTSIVDGATNVLFCDHYVKHLRPVLGSRRLPADRRRARGRRRFCSGVLLKLRLGRWGL